MTVPRKQRSHGSIGKRIHKEKLNAQAGYHNANLTDFSADLDIGVLMQLQDPDERAFCEDLALDDTLSAKRLTVAIKGNRYADAITRKPGTPIKLPRPTDKVTLTIKGTDVTHEGSNDEPAYKIEQEDGGEVLKSGSELEGA